jgi:hypothetical protein
VSGRVWLHAVDGMKPYANARLFGWVESGSSGRTTGPVTVGANGDYRFTVPEGARVRIYAGDYQPCQVTLDAVVGDATSDIRVVTDPLQLGAHLPAQLLEDAARLSGTVFETVEDGRRMPLKDVRVELDGLYGLGLVTATTLTDADGRYILCGVRHESSAYLFASRTGYRLFEASVGAGATLDIELLR